MRRMTQRAVVDFPEPDSPTRPTTDPRSTWKLTSSTARNVSVVLKRFRIGNSLTRFSTRSTGVVMTRSRFMPD